jgi:conjugative relaxase-like TrwC/TraI family protein
MLTIAKLGSWSAAYYVDTARSALADARSAGGGLAEYYSEGETRQPVWLVAAGDAAGRDETAWLAGVQADADADLDAVTAWVGAGVAPSGRYGRAYTRRSVHGFDLTFCVPKSVSLLRGLGDDVTGKAVAAAHQHAIREGLAYLVEHAGYTRVHNPDTGEKDLVRLPGLVAAAFQHETSRAGDPHLHTHVLVPNRQPRADGRLVSIDGTSLYHEARAAGIIYQATLRQELTRLLGVGWNTVDRHTGMAEIAGLDPTTIAAWSRRKTALTEWAQQNLIVGDTLTAGQAAAAQKATRPVKPEGLAWASLRAQWAHDERGISFDQATQVEARRRQRRRRSRAEIATAAVAAIDKAAFTRADLIEALGAQLTATDTGSVSPRQYVEDLAETIAIRVTDPRAAHQREGTVRYTAAELIEEETAIIDVLGAADERAVIPIIGADTELLSADQAAAVTAIAASNRLIQPLSAPAGAGKTTSLKALRAAANRAGKQVVVAAPTGRAVSIAVREHAGDTGATVHKLLRQLDTGKMALDADTLLIVDEAGMVGTLQLRRLLDVATTTGTKVVLVGDPHQLRPVAARDGTFAALCEDLPWAQHLSEVWRMTDPAERAASLALRHGGAAAVRHAVRWYQHHDRLRTGDAVTMADDALADWRADRAAGRDVLLLADRWDVVDALNTRIQAERIAPDTPMMAVARGHRVGIGDVAITRRNTAGIHVATDTTWSTPADPIRNGQRWMVERLDTRGDRLLLRRLDDNAVAVVPGDYARHHLHLGYAITIHAAQGTTTANARAILSAEHATRDTAYVALTRGRHTNTAYIYESETEAATADGGVHLARLGSPAEAAAALRGILGRTHRSHTITATAATNTTAPPKPVADLQHQYRQTLTRLRAEHRRQQQHRRIDGLTLDQRLWLEKQLRQRGRRGHHSTRDDHLSR